MTIKIVFPFVVIVCYTSHVKPSEQWPLFLQSLSIPYNNQTLSHNQSVQRAIISGHLLQNQCKPQLHDNDIQANLLLLKKQLLDPAPFEEALKKFPILQQLLEKKEINSIQKHDNVAPWSLDVMDL